MGSVVGHTLVRTLYSQFNTCCWTGIVALRTLSASMDYCEIMCPDFDCRAPNPGARQRGVNVRCS